MMHSRLSRTVELFLMVGMILLMAKYGVCAADNGVLPGAYAILGLGGDSCGKFIASKQRNTSKIIDGMYAGYTFYAQGYITGLNMHFFHLAPNINTKLLNILEGTDMDGVMLWLENYCNKNPLDNFESAVKSLVIERLPTVQQHVNKGVR